MTISSKYHDLCRQVLNLDLSIRFAGIATSNGKILATLYREGVQPLLSPQESELAIMQSVIRMGIRRTFEQKLGKTIYAMAVYEKVKRTTISLFSGEEGIGKYNNSYLIVSFEKEANAESIINGKILPLLRGKIGKGLAMA